MQTLNIRHALIASAFVTTTLITGCASVVVGSDAIEKNTAFTLGLEKGTFTISDRIDDGIRTDYVVKTDSGKKFRCYVTGFISYTGRDVTDAMCSEVGKQSSMTKTGGTCNALLKAAGKCS